MNCKNCGYLNSKNLNFCKNCGDPLFSYKKKEEVEKFSDIDYTGMYGAEYLKKNKKKKVFVLLLFLFILIVLGAAFLPYSKIGGNIENYVYIESSKKILFGVYVMGVSFLSLILMGLNKKIPVLVLQSVAFGISIFDMIVNNDIIGRGLSNYYYGFYIFNGALFLTVVFSLIRLFSKKFK